MGRRRAVLGDVAVTVFLAALVVALLPSVQVSFETSRVLTLPRLHARENETGDFVQTGGVVVYVGAGPAVIFVTAATHYSDLLSIGRRALNVVHATASGNRTIGSHVASHIPDAWRCAGLSVSTVVAVAPRDSLVFVETRDGELRDDLACQHGTWFSTWSAMRMSAAYARLSVGATRVARDVPALLHFEQLETGALMSYSWGRFTALVSGHYLVTLDVSFSGCVSDAWTGVRVLTSMVHYDEGKGRCASSRGTSTPGMLMLNLAEGDWVDFYATSEGGDATVGPVPGRSDHAARVVFSLA